MALRIRPLKLKGTFEIALEPHLDARGYFARVYDEAIFCEHGLTTAWVQENQSLSARKGLIRGLHFQSPPHAETKLIRVVEGAVLDVFVDLRKRSETFGRWDSIELSAENLKMVYLPRGIAHGFCTLTDRALVQYKVDACYAPESEGGVRWDDPTLKIDWPTRDPFVSEKDRNLPAFEELASPF